MTPRWMIAAWLALASQVVTAEPVELPQLLANEEFRSAWEKLVREEERLPDWVLNLDGQAFPMIALEAAGRRYLFGKLCQIDDCGQERLLVLIDRDWDRAHALYVRLPEALPEDRAPSRHAYLRWLGDPNAAQRRLLEEQLSLEPDWY